MIAVSTFGRGGGAASTGPLGTSDANVAPVGWPGDMASGEVSGAEVVGPTGGGAAGAVPPPGGHAGTAPPYADQRFQALVEHSTDIVLVLGADGAIVYASTSASRVLGYAFEEWRGKDAFAAVHPGDREQVRQAYTGVVAHAGQAVPLAFRVVRADGTSVETEAVATNRLDDPAVAGVVINLRDISERVRVERDARVMDDRYRSLVASLAEGVLLVDADGVALLCNEALEDMFGVPSRMLVGATIPEIVRRAGQLGVLLVDVRHRPVPIDSHPVIVALASGRSVAGTVHGVLRPGREALWLQINARALVEADGTPGGVVASFADVTAVRQASARLEEALAELRSEQTFLQVLLDNLEEGIVACDAQGRITLVNPASRRFFGIPDGEDPAGLALSADGLRRLDGTAMAREENPLVRALAGEAVREAQLEVESRQGERRTVVANAQALRDDDGNELGAVVALHDVTEHKRTEERLAELALHDPLTGVANRLLLDDRIRRALDRLRRGGGGVGVFLLDLDDFKAVNDVYGHDIGDEVLRAAAGRLLATTRPEDTVARLGGDEFVVVCEVSGGAEEVSTIAARVDRALSEVYRFGDTELAVVASVGGVLVDSPGIEPSKLISLADDEMYRVKAVRRRSRLLP